MVSNMTPAAPSRRRLLVGGAALTTAAAAQSLGAEAASAATVNPYPATSVPGGPARHYLNRLGCGYSRSTWAAAADGRRHHQVARRAS